MLGMVTFSACRTTLLGSLVAWGLRLIMTKFYFHIVDKLQCNVTEVQIVRIHFS